MAPLSTLIKGGLGRTEIIVYPLYHATKTGILLNAFVHRDCESDIPIFILLFFLAAAMLRRVDLGER